MSRVWHGVGFVVVAIATTAHAQCPRQRLMPDPDGEFGDFGAALGMNEAHLIVGDRHDNRLCTIDPTCANGIVYAYRKDASGRWTLAELVTPDDWTTRMAFGRGLALDGDRMLVGAAGDGAGSGHGAAYIFEFDGERWQQAARLLNPGVGSFGEFVALRGDLALIRFGARVGVYYYEGGQWTRHQVLEPDDPSILTAFGTTLAIGRERVVIGAELDRSIAGNGGSAYVYRREADGNLTFEQKLIPPDVMEARGWAPVWRSRARGWPSAPRTRLAWPRRKASSTPTSSSTAGGSCSKSSCRTRPPGTHASVATSRWPMACSPLVPLRGARRAQLAPPRYTTTTRTRAGCWRSTLCPSSARSTLVNNWRSPAA